MNLGLKKDQFSQTQLSLQDFTIHAPFSMMVRFHAGGKDLAGHWAMVEAMAKTRPLLPTALERAVQL